MRLRQFRAGSTSAAFALVRDELGTDAIILSTQTDGAGIVHVTAAADRDAIDAPPGASPPPSAHNPDINGLRAILANHNIEPVLSDCLLQAADPTIGDATAVTALSSVFRFDPIDHRASRPIILVGPPGAGKTVTTAKLAARARLSGASVRVIATDTLKAGAMAQLQALTDALGIGLRQADGNAELSAAIAASAGGDLIIVDSVGVNPYVQAECNYLRDLISTADAEPIALLPASLDRENATAAAHAFVELGCRRLIATHLDLTLTMGAVLSAAYHADLALAEASDTPAIAGGLTPLNSPNLAKMLSRSIPDAPMGTDQ